MENPNASRPGNLVVLMKYDVMKQVVSYGSSNNNA